MYIRVTRQKSWSSSETIAVLNAAELLKMHRLFETLDINELDCLLLIPVEHTAG